MAGSGAGQIAVDPGAPYGYSRSAELQQQFEHAAAALRASDGWSEGGSTQLVADLALEGGGVKGIGIVGAVSALAEAGYRFQRVAGTSAGAIAASLIAAISKKGDPLTTLQKYLDNLTFDAFMPKGKLHAFMDHHFGNAGEILTSAEVLTHKMGVYDGSYLFDMARADPARPRRAHLRGPQDLAGRRPRHEPSREPPLSPRRAHVGHHPRPARPPAVGLRLLRPGPGRAECRAGRASVHVDPVLLRAGHLHGAAGRGRPSPSGRGLHRHPLRGRHGDVGGRRHAAELPDRRLRPGGRRAAPLAHHRDQALRPPHRHPVHAGGKERTSARRGAACTR